VNSSTLQRRVLRLLYQINGNRAEALEETSITSILNQDNSRRIILATTTIRGTMPPRSRHSSARRRNRL
jgi:hypothetical protein